MSVSDREVLRFMQSNDLDAQTGEKRVRGDFGMGRPVREVCVALERITGTHQNESGIFSHVPARRRAAAPARAPSVLRSGPPLGRLVEEQLESIRG